MSNILEIKKLNKSFSGFKAINDLNLVVERGELSSIIGPNGAGKTTLFNLITGFHRPDSGNIIFNGKPIVGIHPHKLVRMGISRAFQRCNIFPKLTVFENVKIAVLTRSGKNLDMFKNANGFKEVNHQVREILSDVGLMDKWNAVAGKLSHGDQKRLDIAIALAMNPQLLLLDEPTAGVSPEESRRIIDLVQDIWEKKKITILFIEHDMDMVFTISQKVRVLFYGELIAEGPPHEVAQNEKVIEVYLGMKHTG